MPPTINENPNERVVWLRVPDPLDRKLRAIAKRTGNSLSSTMRDLLDQAADAREQRRQAGSNEAA